MTSNSRPPIGAVRRAFDDRDAELANVASLRFLVSQASASLPSAVVPANSSSITWTIAATATSAAAVFGTTAGTVTVGNDARLSDARTPLAHHVSHQDGGTDEVSTATAAANAIPKAGAGGTLAIGWIPLGSSSSTVCVGNDARLSNSRTPTTHGATHLPGSPDQVFTADSGWTVVNDTPLRNLDVASTVLADLANVVATMLRAGFANKVARP